jgi:iodotyrosine deiodinase
MSETMTESKDTRPEASVQQTPAQADRSAVTSPVAGAASLDLSGAPAGRHVPHHRERYTTDELLARGEAYHRELDHRRSVRFFSADAVPREAIEWALRAAGTAPSGAHQQPWTFVVVDDAQLKREIRVAAEEEEREFYARRATAEWLEAIAPLGTDPDKPFLEVAPYLIVVFEQAYGHHPDGRRKKHYYVRESVGLASGMLLAALNAMGLATLTHTPSPMGFLGELLGRPDSERPFLLIPVGYPADDATVPDLQRKSLSEIAVWNRG